MNVERHQASANPRPSQTTVSPPVQAARVYNHHLLLLLSPKADTYFTVPRRVEGWVDLVYSIWFTRPQMVTHPGTNRIWRNATTLIKANAFPLSQTANVMLLLQEHSGPLQVYWQWDDRFFIRFGVLDLLVTQYMHLSPAYCMLHISGSRTISPCTQAAGFAQTALYVTACTKHISD